MNGLYITDKGFVRKESHLLAIADSKKGLGQVSTYRWLSIYLNVLSQNKTFKIYVYNFYY